MRVKSSHRAGVIALGVNGHARFHSRPLAKTGIRFRTRISRQAPTVSECAEGKDLEFSSSPDGGAQV